MRKKVFIIALTTLLVVSTISIAFSHRPGRRGKGFGTGFYGLRAANLASTELNLTQEQVQKLQPLRADFDKETLPLRNEIQIKTLELRQLWIADELDEEAIVAKAKEVSDLQNQLQGKMIHHRIDFAKVLTKEQRIQFSPIGRRGRNHRYGFGMGRGRHRDW